MNDGFLDAMVRGFQLNLLNKTDYENLTQCDSLEDMKLQLQQTAGYKADFLQNEASPLHATTIAARCTQKMVEEYEYLRSNSTYPLSKFLDFCTYGYMIDNVVLLITGTLHKRNVVSLKEKCHQLGVFENMAAITVGQTDNELYHQVLVDTPLGPYIVKHLSEAEMNERNIEFIRNTLYKAYFEDFDNFCTDVLGGTTGEVMHELLQFEADRRSMNITLNSFGTELSPDDREKLYPSFGLLYPEGTQALAKADDQEKVRQAVDHIEIYRKLFIDSSMKEDKTLEDSLFEYEVQLNLKSFEFQYSYGVFYSYFRLKEQEIRNIVWIAECILQGTAGAKAKINNYIAPVYQ